MVSLPEYLEEKGETYQAFADRIGRSRTIVYYWCIGQRSPNSISLDRIIKATGGRVEANDVLRQLELPGVLR